MAEMGCCSATLSNPATPKTAMTTLSNYSTICSCTSSSSNKMNKTQLATTYYPQQTNAQHQHYPYPSSSLYKIQRQFLSNAWTFWYYEFKRGMNWNECQHEISSFRTMEQFWLLYDNIKSASQINVTCDYAFFKNGIRPMWEDDCNRTGGRWIIDIPKGYQLDEINVLWMKILLQLIGEHFYLAELICGAVFSNRIKRNKIAIWMKHGSEQAIQSIGFQIRRNFQIADDIPVTFKFHHK
jgi:translation initiation factor 4E